MRQTTNPTKKHGFTLVELLVAISIIGVLASMILVMVRGVEADARISKTRGTISKINEVLAAKYELLLTAPMSITIPERALQLNSIGTPLLLSREAALARLVAMRDRLRMILPCRHEDLPIATNGSAVPFIDFFPPTMIQLRADPSGGSGPLMPLDSIISLTEEEIAQLTNEIPAESYAIAQSFIARFVNFSPGKGVSPQNGAWWTNNENAELLYAIVESSTVNGASAIELFKPSEIGDTDADNCPEFIDAWGTPIGFIRWPAGSRLAGASVIEDPFGSGDPFDPIKADVGYDRSTSPPGGYLPGKGLFPMVVSAGPNGLFGINGIEARKPEFAAGSDVYTDKVLFGVGEMLPTEFGLPTDELPLVVSPSPTQISGMRYSLRSFIDSYDIEPRSYGDLRRDGYLYPDPYFPRGAIDAVRTRRAGFEWYQNAAADNITNLDPSGESL